MLLLDDIPYLTNTDRPDGIVMPSVPIEDSEWGISGMTLTCFRGEYLLIPKQHNNSVAAVSYTHLPLPTNREV